MSIELDSSYLSSTTPCSETCKRLGHEEEDEELDVLLEIVSEFPVSAAADPSQLGPTHFKECCVTLIYGRRLT